MKFEANYSEGTINGFTIDTRDPNPAYNDFFVEDIKGFLTDNNIRVFDLMYITDFHAYTERVNLELTKNSYVKLLEKFVANNNGEFIMVRIGYDPDTEDKEQLKRDKQIFIEKYVALEEVGFMDVDYLTGFEHSQTFVYQNTRASKFLEAFRRSKARDFIAYD